jgi:hypothetical protein
VIIAISRCCLLDEIIIQVIDLNLNQSTMDYHILEQIVFSDTSFTSLAISLNTLVMKNEKIWNSIIALYDNA